MVETEDEESLVTADGASFQEPPPGDEEQPGDDDVVDEEEPMFTKRATLSVFLNGSQEEQVSYFGLHEN